MSALLIAAMLATATPAELPPWVYQRARDNAASVIVIAVDRVTGLDGGDQGSCTVVGHVTEVERGTEHVVGDRVSIAVPCIGAAWRPRPGPWPGFNEASFLEIERGRAWTTGGALVLKGFDVLSPDAD